MNLEVNSNTQNYDITYHELRFSVDPNNTIPFINGIVKTTFTALSNMNTVTFDMATALVVSSVSMNSTNLTFSQSNYELNITLPTTVTTGNSATLDITYAGSPPQAEGAFTRGTHSGTPIIFTLSEPFGARDWWPCKQDLNDKIEDNSDTTQIRPKIEYYDQYSPGRVCKIIRYKNDQDAREYVIVKICKTSLGDSADKMSTDQGQKGVIGQIVSASEFGHNDMNFISSVKCSASAHTRMTGGQLLIRLTNYYAILNGNIIVEGSIISGKSDGGFEKLPSSIT